MARSAVVYLVNGRLVIGSNRRTTAGFHLSVEPREMQAHATAEDVRNVLSSALDASLPVAATPTDWKGQFDPFLAAAGVRSYKAFMSSARSVGVDEADGEFTVTPYLNLGAKDGFGPIPCDASKLPDVGAAARAVLEMLQAH